MSRLSRDRASDPPVDVLVVEPDPHDADFIADLLADTEIRSTVHVTATGDEALKFAYQRGEYAEAPRPAIVLLDLHLPDMSGTDVLRELKTESALRQIPVIVMTTDDDDDAVIARSYELYANAHVQKPVDTDEFEAILRSFANFWLTTAQLPPTE